MLKRYELTDDEWGRIQDLPTPETKGTQGQPPKDSRTIPALPGCGLLGLCVRRFLFFLYIFPNNQFRNHCHCQKNKHNYAIYENTCVPRC